MLNKKQYVVLKKIIKEIEKDNPGKRIIGYWSIIKFKLNENEIQTLNTINFTPIDSTINKFGWAFGSMINIDSKLVDLINEYEEKHNWKKTLYESFKLLGIIFSVIISAIQLIKWIF